MSDQPGPSHFQQLFKTAYEKQTGKTLANHPIAEKLQSCDSVESVTAVLREQTETSNEIRGKNGVLKPLKNVLSVLHKLSSAVSFGRHLGLPLPPVKAIHTGVGILLSAVKGVLDDYDTLADLLESVEHLLNRLDIYIKIPPTDNITEVIIKILVDLLSILALTTKQVQQGKLKALVKKLLLGRKDIEMVLQRLGRLTEDEARITVAQTLDVHGLVQNMKDMVGDGKKSLNHAWDALDIQELASDKNRSKRDKLELEKDIRTWLSPPEPWKDYNIVRKLRHRGSATWFVQGNTFSEWKRSEAPSSLLWVYGKQGSGKSVLCSAIVEDIDTMQKAGLASLAFFYCDFEDGQKRGLRGLLSSLLVQLCHQSDTYCNVLSEFYSEHANGSRYPGDDALARCLNDLLKLPGHAPVYLIVDALDECSNTSSIPSPRDEVLNLIEEPIKSEIPHLRICVTSRPEMDINNALDPLIFRSVSLDDERGQKNDIEEYITSVINTDPKNKTWEAEDRRLVIDVLTRKADGMFRWVYCQLLQICGCTPARLRHALTNLPETLDERYEHTLREINKAKRGFAHRLFRFVTVSTRDKDSQTQIPLHLASQAGQQEGSRMMIERDTNVSTQNTDGQAPLHLVFLENWTPLCGHPENERGENVSNSLKDGQTPLHLASRAEDVSAQDKTSSHPALQEEQPEIACMLIESGTNVSAQDKDHQTPLHLVSRARQLEVACMLIAECGPGASVSALNKNGQTLSHLVFLSDFDTFLDTSGHREVARILIERGVDVSESAQDKDG